MDDNELVGKRKPEELIRAKNLIDKGKYDKALQLMKIFEETGEHTLYEIVSCNLLKCNILHQQGLYENALQLAEQTYKESLGLGKNLLSIDALIVMADASIFLGDTNKFVEIIKQGEDLLNFLTQISPIEYKRREAKIYYIKGFFYTWLKTDADRALDYIEHSLALQEEIGAKHDVAKSLIILSWVLGGLKGELDRALKYAERGLALAKESNKKFTIALSLVNLAAVYSGKGELDRSVIFYEQSLAIYKELNNKFWMATVLNNVGNLYRNKGELYRALECLEQSLALHQELGNLREIAKVHDFLIQILIDKGDLERAQQALRDLEQLNNQLKDNQSNLWYLFDKALLLKTSLRARNRAKAEEIFNQLLEDKDIGFEMTIGALLNLCELLLIELRMTNDVEVLDEINPLIVRLLDIAEKSNSYSILAETYFLQAKLSLLTFDIKKVQGFLTQAQQLAERFGLTQLATKIASESDDLLKKLDLWEKLKESGAPMTERLELARLDEKIVGIVYKHTDLTTKVTVEEVAISKEKKICLVCRGEVLRFSYICECGVIYCGNCAQAITNLENACWACDAPIDFLKPVKPYKDEEERVEMREKSKKN